MMTTTVTVRMNQEDSSAIRAYAHVHGVSVSEAMRRAILEKIEDEYDLKLLDDAVKRYEANPVSHTHEEVKKELGL